MSDDLLGLVASTQDAVVLELRPDGSFAALTDSPGWFTGLFRDQRVNGHGFDLAGALPALDEFLADARSVWVSGEPSTRRSGALHDLSNGTAGALEAIAGRCGRRSILILQRKQGERLESPFDSSHDDEVMHEQSLEKHRMNALGRLAGGIAHDFNNLLTAILGYGEILESAFPDDDPACRNLHQIREAAERGSMLTQRLLALGRQDSATPETLDVSEVVISMQTILERVVPSEIDLMFDLTRESTTVEIDRGKLEQALLNLVVNACEAMPDGGALEIGTRVREADARKADGLPPSPSGCCLELWVRDRGCGIAEEVVGHVFDPFFSTKEQGAGLGLSTVYSTVTRNGGVVRIESELDKGSTIRALIPCMVEVTETIAAPPAASETVLIVEDEEPIRRLMELILTGQGYTALTAANGREAMDLLSTSPIDLVLTDVVMPGMGGLELRSKVSAVAPEVPVLLMSGYAMDAFAAHRPLAEGVSLISKPVTQASLLRAIREALSEPSGLAETMVAN